jgi:hypothetical protein
MRARESSTALSGWNVCDGVQQQPEFPVIPATARLADCWVDGGNRVTQADNELAFGTPIPGQPATRDVELYFRQKELHLAGLCAHPESGSSKSGFNYSGIAIEFKNGAGGQALQDSCPCSGLPSSCAVWRKILNFGQMNQPLVAHKWSDASGAGFFAATWDVQPGWTAAQRRSVLQALTSYTSAWVAYREAELTHGTPSRPVAPPLLANKSFAFAAWSHRNGSRVYYSALQTSNAYHSLMNYLRVNDISNVDTGYGGYPWDGFGIMNGPAPNSARMKVTLRVIESGHGHNQFYLPEIAGCWKLDGSPCNGALATDWPKSDITRYLCFIIAPSVTPHCSADDQKFCPPWHIMSADGARVYRNDTERFPYSCYYEHCWAPNDPAVPRDGTEVTCDPFSNPNPQEIIAMLPCSEWGVHGFPTQAGEGWTGDARLWNLDVGGLGSRVFLQGKEPAPGATATTSTVGGIARMFPGTNRSWISFEIGPESPADHNIVRWEVQDVDVEIPRSKSKFKYNPG